MSSLKPQEETLVKLFTKYYEYFNDKHSFLSHLFHIKNTYLLPNHKCKKRKI